MRGYAFTFKLRKWRYWAVPPSEGTGVELSMASGQNPINCAPNPKSQPLVLSVPQPIYSLQSKKE